MSATRRLANTVIRRCRFTPYRKGLGPTFALLMTDTGRVDDRGCTTIGYRLTMTTNTGDTVVLFEGTDFHGSPMHGDDADETVQSLMGFLCLKPGDTDGEYFAGYTKAQRDFAATDADALLNCVCWRFGTDR